MYKRRLIIDACQFTPNYNYCLLEALARGGERVFYATTKFAHGEVPDPPGVTIVRCFFFLARFAATFVSSDVVRRALRAIEYPFNWGFLLLFIVAKRIHVVHFMWVVSPRFELVLIRLLKRMGRNVVFTAHNPFPHEEKAADREVYSRIYRSVDHTIALTAYTRDEIVTTAAVERGRISVIPHGDYGSLFDLFGCNEEIASKVRQKAGQKRVVSFLGGVRPYKGLKYFIEAFPMIKARMPNCFFVIAGSVLVGNQSRLTCDLQTSPCRDDLWYDLRFLPIPDLKAYLCVTDLLVQPYVSASQSGNTAMAYSAGIPVISSAVGGLAEMTTDGETGYVVEPANPSAIADAVAKCFQEGRYKQMSENARRAAAEKYNWNTIAEQTAAVYAHFSK